jgi:membrane associated rhomboid family serine protease
MDPSLTLPPPPTEEHCYRHPDRATGVHCTRCGRPICPECMVPASVGHHCPTCVAEAREEFQKGPGRRIAVANLKAFSMTNLLLAAIIGMYVVEVVVGGAGSFIGGPTTLQLVNLGAAIGLATVPGGGVVGIANGQYWRLFSSMFLHAGLLHLAFNAYALWIFGQVVEAELGRLRLLAIFLTTGLFAGAASYAFGNPAVAGVGASGAIFGVFGAFVAFNWRRRHTALASARLRTAVMIIVLNAVIGFSAGGEIDWRAHVGGFLAGLVAGYAAEGFGRVRNERAAFVVGCVAILVATVGLVAWRTAQLNVQFPPLG